MGSYWIVIAVIGAILGYRESEKFKQENGVTPWSMPSVVWASIMCASLLIGAILISIAKRKTAPVSAAQRFTI